MLLPILFVTKMGRFNIPESLSEELKYEALGHNLLYSRADEVNKEATKGFMRIFRPLAKITYAMIKINLWVDHQNLSPEIQQLHTISRAK